MGDTPLVINHTRGALCGGKCGDRGRDGFDDDGAVLVMTGREAYTDAWRHSICYMYPRWWLIPACALIRCGDGIVTA
jgi:hypothetical protein